jgi:hypothetical protein
MVRIPVSEFIFLLPAKGKLRTASEAILLQRRLVVKEDPLPGTSLDSSRDVW